MIKVKSSIPLATAISTVFLLTSLSAHATDQQDQYKQEWEKETSSSNKDNQSTTNNQANTNVDLSRTPSYDLNVNKLMDMDVVGGTGEKIGTISDVLLSNQGKITSVILSVGGVMGVGDKLVAVPFQSLQINRAQEEVRLNVTEKQLEQASEFQLKQD